MPNEEPKLSRADFTPSYVEEIIRDNGGVLKRAAAAIHKQCVDDKGRAVSANCVRVWMSDVRNGHSHQVLKSSSPEGLNRLAKLLDESGVSSDAIARIKKVKLNTYGIHAKVKKQTGVDYKGKPIFEEVWDKDALHSTTMEIEPNNEDPAWIPTQYAAPTVIVYDRVKADPKPLQVVVVLPDVQCGFLRDIDTGELEPMHDDDALDVAFQIVSERRPNKLIWAGDFLDFPEMSRWPQHPEMVRTTQPAIDRAHVILATAEAAAGPKRLPTELIPGNHDKRIREFLYKNAAAAYHLRPANSTPKDWPDLSVPHLLRLEELNIKYLDEYPGGQSWITDELVVRHAPDQKYVLDASVIAGHSHQIKSETYSRRTRDGGTRWYTNYEIGCLCRVDETSSRTRMMRTRVPSDKGLIRNWSQGLCVVTIDEDGQYSVEQVHIRDGKAIFRDRLYVARKK